MDHMTISLLFAPITQNGHGVTVRRFDTITGCLARNESSLVRK